MTIITEISLYGYQITTCLLQKRSDEKRKCPILWQFIAIILLRPLFREIIICTSAEIIILKKFHISVTVILFLPALTEIKMHF